MKKQAKQAALRFSKDDLADKGFRETAIRGKTLSKEAFAEARGEMVADGVRDSAKKAAIKSQGKEATHAASNPIRNAVKGVTTTVRETVRAEVDKRSDDNAGVQAANEGIADAGRAVDAVESHSYSKKLKASAQAQKAARGAEEGAKEATKSATHEAQKQAVTTTEGFVRVVAGAGSGKTRALSSRFAYLVNDLGILPGNILCVTFTNKAANEMRRRIHNLTGDNDTGYINTFHGFCVNVLQEESHVVQYPKSFLVLDASDIDDMLSIVYAERGLTLRDMTYSDARDMIEMIKLVEMPDYYIYMIEMDLELLKKRYDEAETVKDIIFYGYLYQQKKCFGLDYDDLISFVLYIFSKNEESKLKWQKRLEYIMIDEFQDIDRPQYTLMQVLCGYHHNLFIVGDPDQTIYTWRGASTKFLMDFNSEYQTTQTIMMMENYRSTYRP